ncbi:hypothetical protein HK102_013163, partial [Quaeritorhiza haematococci]
MEHRRDYLRQLPESPVERNEYVLIPVSSMNATLSKPARGSLCISSLPSGVFVFVWDNTQIQKKAPKPVAYKASIRSFWIHRPLGPPPNQRGDSSASLDDTLSRRAFGGSSAEGASSSASLDSVTMRGGDGFVTGMQAEVVVGRKAVFKVVVIYDRTMGVAVVGGAAAHLSSSSSSSLGG